MIDRVRRTPRQRCAIEPIGERPALAVHQRAEPVVRPVDERPALLAEACADDTELRREVESLLAQDASADTVLTRGAVVAAAGLVSDVGGSVLVGRRLDAYQIVAPLGAGGMGCLHAPARRRNDAVQTQIDGHLPVYIHAVREQRPDDARVRRRTEPRRRVLDRFEDRRF
jgi:hypothetical protein